MVENEKGDLTYIVPDDIQDRQLGLQGAVEADAAENAKPKDREGGWNENDATEEFTDRSPFRDTSNEHADKRDPGEPPDHVGERPGLEPICPLLIHERKGTKPMNESTAKIVA